MHAELMFVVGRKDVKLLSVKVDGKALSESDYKLTPESLTISSPPSGTFQVRQNVGKLPSRIISF